MTKKTKKTAKKRKKPPVPKKKPVVAKKKPKTQPKTQLRPQPKIQGEEIKRTKIRVIGIGGGGGNIVSEIAARMPKASFVAANTDSQALKAVSRKVSRFLFGQNLTHGLGTGMKADLGEEAALQEKEKIEKLLAGQDLCVLVVCLGGGAGSGAAPLFAKISKNLGNLTYGIFTLPFKFEGEKKMEIAKDALKKIKNHLNALTIIPNERVFQIVDKDTPLKQALSIINKNLSESLGGLIETIYEPGLINIDFADFKTILEGQGKLAYLNTVEVQRKEDSIKDLIEQVLASPLYPYNIRGAKGVMFNIGGEKDLSLSEVNQISKTISDLANSEAKIIFGISQGKKYSDIIRTTLLATGCGMKSLSSESEEKKPKRRKRTIFRKLGIGRGEEKEVPQMKSELKKEPEKTKKPKRKKNKMSKKTKSQISSETKKEETEISDQPEAKRIIPVKTAEALDVSTSLRKNALQIKKEAEELEKEMLAKEEVWETPAFLRRQKNST